MIDSLCADIKEWAVCEELDRLHRFQTMIQMPSGSVLSLTARPHGSQWIVSDSGSAFEEVTSCGCLDVNTNKATRFLEKRGLKLYDGRIESPPVDKAQLQAAAVAVGNVSKKLAETLLVDLKNKTDEKIQQKTKAILVNRFRNLVSSTPLYVKGSSEKEYKFEIALKLRDSRTLFVDPVRCHQVSINATIARNLDLFQKRDEKILQRIVFDAAEEWKTEQIRQLSSFGVPAVSVEALPDAVGRIVN